MIVDYLPIWLKNVLKSIPGVHKLYLMLFRCLSPYFNRQYKHWIAKIEPSLWLPVLPDQDLCLSIIVPVYNPPITFLKACVNSVLKQNYTHWQLVIVNDASTNQQVNRYLKSLNTNNQQIVVITHEQNKHISVATNTGLEHCNGDYVLLLDHDDLLAPQALNEVASLLSEKPALQWLYSDEDFVNKKGKRVSPHFKSDWNPYLLEAHNYITHLSVYKRSLLIELGGCRIGFEGAQDYDLALRVAERLQPEQIAHIAKILYHWRVHDGSSSSSNDAKPYTVKAGRNALIEHFQRIAVSCHIKDGNLDNFYHAQYVLATYPKVSIIIPTRDHKEVLEKCISSVLAKTDYTDFEIIVMDNQSQALDALSYLAEIAIHENVFVIEHDKPFNYSEINNRAVDLASGEVVVLLNNDTEVINRSWLKELVGLAMQPDVGCVGAKLLYPDSSIQHAGIVMGLGGYAAHSHRCLPQGSYGYFNRPHINQVISGVTGACLAVRKHIYSEVGGLDEDYQVAYNDVDFCLKVKKAGFYNVYCAGAELVHFESKTRGEDNNDENKSYRFEQEKALLLSKWSNEINSDPYYSPHLTRESENFSIRAGFYKL